jgi:hypothetical protein
MIDGFFPVQLDDQQPATIDLTLKIGQSLKLNFTPHGQIIKHGSSDRDQLAG